MGLESTYLQSQTGRELGRTPVSRSLQQTVDGARDLRLDRGEQDDEVEGDGPVLDVEEVQAGVGIEGRVVPGFDLPETGDARHHVCTTAQAQRERFDLLGKRGARADEAHLAPEHVPELGELVHGGRTEEATDGRDARIVFELEQRTLPNVPVSELTDPFLRIDDHRPELEHLERLAGSAHANLAEQGGAPVPQADERHRREQRRAADHEEE